MDSGIGVHLPVMLFGNGKDGIALTLNLDADLTKAIVGSSDMDGINRHDTLFHEVKTILDTAFGTSVTEHVGWLVCCCLEVGELDF